MLLDFEMFHFHTSTLKFVPKNYLEIDVSFVEKGNGIFVRSS